MRIEEKISLLSEEAQEAVYAIAHTSFRQGIYQEALSLFQTLTCANPRQRKFWLGQAACFQALKEYERALDSYERVLMLDPRDVSVHLHAAHCLFSLKKIGEGLKALVCAEKACAKAPAESREGFLNHISVLRHTWRNRHV